MSWESLNYISDIIVVVENKEYHLHKAYLVNIPYFETIIKGNYYTNNRIIMDEIVKKEPFESIMNDIYNVYRKIFDYSGVLKHNVTYIDNITESIEKLILLRYYNLTSIEEILLNYFSKEIMCSEKYPTYEELDRLYEIGYLLENDISSQDKEINYCLGYDISLKYKIIPTRYLNLVIEVLSLRASNGRTKYGYIDDRYGKEYRIQIYEEDFSIFFDNEAEEYFTKYLYDVTYILSTYKYLSKQTWFFDAISPFITLKNN